MRGAIRPWCYKHVLVFMVTLGDVSTTNLTFMQSDSGALTNASETNYTNDMLHLSKPQNPSHKASIAHPALKLPGDTHEALRRRGISDIRGAKPKPNRF